MAPVAKKSVYIGSEGATPKKEQTFFRFDAPEQVGKDLEAAAASKKKVGGFEVPGETPKKTQTFFKEDAPEQVGLDYARSLKPTRKSVNLGAAGDTPKKVTTYQKLGAPSDLDLASPTRLMLAPPLLSATSKYGDAEVPPADPFSSPTGGISGRPKTSRGKARPSPDEFTDYVISPEPSPQRDLGMPPQFMRLHDDDEEEEEDEEGGSDSLRAAAGSESFPIDDDIKQTQKQVQQPSSAFGEMMREREQLPGVVMALLGVALLA